MQRPFKLICHMVKSCLLSLAVLGLLLTVGSCSEGPKPNTDLGSILSKASSAQQRTSELNAKLFSVFRGPPQPGDYVLQEGDLLDITVFGVNDLTSSSRIGGKGTITLPLLGELKVAGLTARQGEKKIQDAYGQKYLRNPRVRIFVKEQHGSKITVLGEVKKPGTYDYYSQQRLMQVLALGGGLSDQAGQVVQVSRKSDDPNHPNVYFIDLDKLINKANYSLNIRIEGGDVIYVPVAGTVYVDGAVRKPGTYTIKHNMTVQEVLAAAGLKHSAKRSAIKLARLKNNGYREIVQLSMDDIQQGKAITMLVKDQDVIFVEKDRLKAFIQGLRPSGASFGPGFFGIGLSGSRPED